MPYCLECGKKLAKGAKFCSNCGKACDEKKQEMNNEEKDVNMGEAQEEKGTSDEKKKTRVSIKELAGNVGEKAGAVAKKSTETLDKTKEAVFNAIDVNGDGQVDIEDVILMAFKVPGVSINREDFLRKELANKYASETIEKWQ